MSIELKNFSSDIEEKASFTIELTIIYAFVWLLNNLKEAEESVMIGQNSLKLSKDSNSLHTDIIDKALRMYYKSLKDLPNSGFQIRLNTTEFINEPRNKDIQRLIGKSYKMSPRLMIWLLDSYKAYE